MRASSWHCIISDYYIVSNFWSCFASLQDPESTEPESTQGFGPIDKGKKVEVISVPSFLHATKFSSVPVVVADEGFSHLHLLWISNFRQINTLRACYSQAQYCTHLQVQESSTFFQSDAQELLKFQVSPDHRARISVLVCYFYPLLLCSVLLDMHSEVV
jgi:hypothetical protein